MSRAVRRFGFGLAVGAMVVGGGCKQGDDAAKGPGGAGGPAAAAGTPSPKEVAVAFAKAVRAGDAAAVRKWSVGSDKSYQTLAALSATWKQLDEFFVVAKAKAALPDKELASAKRQMDWADDLDAEAERGEVKVEGDAATFARRPAADPPAAASRPAVGRFGGAADVEAPGESTFDAEPIKLVKRDGAWKVDADATLAVKRMVRDKDTQFIGELGEKVSQFAAAIREGRKPGGDRAASRPATRP